MKSPQYLSAALRKCPTYQGKHDLRRAIPDELADEVLEAGYCPVCATYPAVGLARLVPREATRDEYACDECPECDEAFNIKDHGDDFDGCDACEPCYSDADSGL